MKLKFELSTKVKKQETNILKIIGNIFKAEKKIGNYVLFTSRIIK